MVLTCAGFRDVPRSCWFKLQYSIQRAEQHPGYDHRSRSLDHYNTCNSAMFFAWTGVSLEDIGFGNPSHIASVLPLCTDWPNTILCVCVYWKCQSAQVWSMSTATCYAQSPWLGTCHVFYDNPWTLRFPATSAMPHSRAPTPYMTAYKLLKRLQDFKVRCFQKEFCQCSASIPDPEMIRMTSLQ